MAEASLILSRRDLEFMLHEWLDVASLTAHPRFAEHSRETFDAVLALAEQIATREFAPHYQESDRNEPQFVEGGVQMIPEVSKALEALRASGLLLGAVDQELGGIQLPLVVYRACYAWLQAANVSTAAYPMLTMASAALLAAHGTQEQIHRYVRPMLEGRFHGTMCLSEPQAGSSLADITTRARRSNDGSYRLTGSKMWISAGDHDLSENIIHLVLARVEDAPAGVKGLSLFIVPKYLVDAGGIVGEHNDVVLAGLNHKMGYRGTTNAVLGFGDGAYRPAGEAGAVGYLVGDEGQGLTYMFHMMNEARIGVGTGAVSLGYTGYLHALEYARTRTQGRPVDAKSQSAAVPIIRHPDVRRMLLASKSYVEGGLALALYAARLVDERDVSTDPVVRADRELLLDVLTPIVKSWPSQWCLAANDLAIQVHGGYGYTREYPVEQMYRDNRLNPIHEGTHGIQGLDLLGRKVRLADGRGLELLVNEIEATIDRATAGAREHAGALRHALRRLRSTTEQLWSDGDAAAALAKASVYLEATGHIVVAWMWLEQELAASGRAGDFYEGKRAAARYFFDVELPKALLGLDELDRGDRLLLELDEAWF